jgi:hypothetical protein
MKAKPPKVAPGPYIPSAKKAKPFKRTPIPVLGGAKADRELARGEVVALVASRVPRESADDDATVRNRVSSKLGYDVRGGKLRRRANGKFAAKDVARWVRAEWPGYFTNLPFPSETVGEDVQGKATVADESDERILPGSLVRCHALINTLYNRIDELERELSDARARATAPAAKAEKWDRWNARKGRKGGRG